MKNLVLSLLLLLFSSVVYAQFDGNYFELKETAISQTDNKASELTVFEDTVNTDEIRDLFTFHLELKPSEKTKADTTKLRVRLGRRKREIKEQIFLIPPIEETERLKFMLPCYRGDVIYIENLSDHSLQKIYLVSKSIAFQDKENIKNYVPNVTFTSRLFENMQAVRLDSTLLSYLKVESLKSNFVFIQDSLFEKSFTDSTFFINSQADRLFYSINEDIYRYWFKDMSPELLSAYLKNWHWKGFLTNDELHNQTIKLTAGRINKKNYKHLYRRFNFNRGKLKDKEGLVSTYPYVAPLFFQMNKYGDSIHYLVIETKQRIIIQTHQSVSKTNRETNYIISKEPKKKIIQRRKRSKRR